MYSTVCGIGIIILSSITFIAIGLNKCYDISCLKCCKEKKNIQEPLLYNNYHQYNYPTHGAL